MSIFRSTFPDHVKKQLGARQDAMTNRTSQNLSYLNSRNAWVRLSSSVNVNGSNQLAKDYILQGGTLNSDGSKKQGLGSDFSYAYSNRAYNKINYRLGIRPMPGITGVEIKSKSAYGSLREAVVSFQCWDIQQLEDLEILYMRPGYTVLLEWGWAPYITSDGQYHSSFYDYYDIINKDRTDRTELFRDLYKKSIKYEGNYDAMFGYVKNYQWSARADGGYDCQTTIITTGEIVESLKINYTRSTTVESTADALLNDEFNVEPPNTQWVNAYKKNLLAGMWAELFYRIKGDGVTENDYKYRNYWLGGHFLSSNSDNQDSLDYGKGNQVYIPLIDVCYYLNKYIIAKSSGDNEPLIKLSTEYRNHTTGTKSDLLCIAHPLQVSVDPGICLIRNTLWGGGDIIKETADVAADDPSVGIAKEAADLIIEAAKGNGTDVSMLIDAANKITNNKIYDAVNANLKLAAETEGNGWSSNYSSIEAVLNGELGLGNWGDFLEIKSALHSAFPALQVEGEEEWTGVGTIKITLPKDYKEDASTTTVVNRASDALSNISYLSKLSEDYPFFMDDDPYSEIGIIGNIYVNVNYLYVKALNAGGVQSGDDKGKEEINVYNYMKSLLKDIQSVTGNINNFELHCDPVDNNVIRIIDVNYTEEKKPLFSSLFRLNVHNLSSNVRSYSLQSQIFPNQGALIAIGSQAKGGSTGIQTNTMIDFNRNLTDRIIPEKVDGIKSKLSVNETDSSTTITNGLAPIVNAFGIDTTPLNNDTNPSYDDEIDAAKTGLRDVISYFQAAVASPGSNRNLIPTKFSCEIDGIGGLIIGNMFRLPNEILPRGYRGGGTETIGSQLGNAITGIAHSIKGGDWVTKIESLNIVMDSQVSTIKFSKELLEKALRGPSWFDKFMATTDTTTTTDTTDTTTTTTTTTKTLPTKDLSSTAPQPKNVPYTVDQVINTMNKKGYRHFKDPWVLNLVGIRNKYKQQGAKVTDSFIDYIIMWYYDNTGKRIDAKAINTTTPGKAFYDGTTGHNFNSLVPNQYKDAYAIGLHQGKYSALKEQVNFNIVRQKAPAPQYDYSIVKNDFPGDNIHRGSASGKTPRISNLNGKNGYSAGCQVFQTVDDFNWMMNAARQQINNTNRKVFDYTLLKEEEIV